MKQRFNLYGGLLIAAIVFSIGLSTFETVYYMYQGGKAGIETARNERKAGVQNSPLKNIERIRRMTPVEMMPKMSYLMETAPADSIVNMKTGEKMPMMTVAGILMPEKSSNRMMVLQATGSLETLFIIIFLVAFIKLVIAVNKGRIFEKRTETLLSWGGWSVLGIYVLDWVNTLYNYLMNVHEFEFELYDLRIMQKPDVALLYAAFGMLLVGQIFKIGRQMKEEQELTI